MNELTIRMLPEKAEEDELELEALWNGAHCGALRGYVEEELLIVDALTVDEDCRGRGIGRALMEEARRLAAEEDLEALAAVYLCPPSEAEARSRWLARQGFFPAEAQSDYTAYTAEEMKKSRLFQLTQGQCPVALVPVAVLNEELLPPLIREEVEENGDLVEESCLAVLSDDGDLRAAVLLSRREGGVILSRIHLRSAQDGTALLWALRRALDAAAGETLLLPEEEKQPLFEKFFEGAESRLVQEYTALLPMEDPEALVLTADYGEALVRFTGLMDALSGRGVACRLVMRSSGAPEMVLSVEKGRKLHLRYERAEADPEEEAREYGYRLTAELLSPQGDLLDAASHREEDTDAAEETAEQFLLPLLARYAAKSGKKGV